MNKKECVATSEFKNKVRSATNKLKWYASDYDNSTINSIAEDLTEALDDFSLVVK